ncbi:hypothetical protein [Paracoccus sp. S1E-3]|nr:hypothetical protein [Paracoccus sp. S1E-3]MBA4490163.1 hypothetical protein [Paracoccus sp. S1E-3]
MTPYRVALGLTFHPLLPARLRGADLGLTNFTPFEALSPVRLNRIYP